MGFCTSFGGQKKTGSPPFFVVDDNPLCYVWGLDGILCKTAEIVVAVLQNKPTLKNLIKILAKQALDTYQNGDVYDTAAFCSGYDAFEPPDITAVDIAFYLAALIDPLGIVPSDLNDRVRDWVLFSKWQDLCECKPSTTPNPNKPNPLQPYSYPPAPEGKCKGLWDLWLQQRQNDFDDAAAELNDRIANPPPSACFVDFPGQPSYQGYFYLGKDGCYECYARMERLFVYVLARATPETCVLYQDFTLQIPGIDYLEGFNFYFSPQYRRVPYNCEKIDPTPTPVSDFCAQYPDLCAQVLPKKNTCCCCPQPGYRLSNGLWLPG